jgi:FAD/FMN-containing dehydrogenase/Fe-S oxidoreductase
MLLQSLVHSSQSNEELNFVDFTGLCPPLPLDALQNAKINAKVNAKANALANSGVQTFLPSFVSEQEFVSNILPNLEKNCPADTVKFIHTRVTQTFELRKKLQKLKPQIEKIVGTGNFSALWLDREAFSSDSMEHRALVTEAVIFIYSAETLQKIVQLLYTESIPMIPYGEGGGYNMGVTPMAPAVTIQLRGIDHISEIRPSRKNSSQNAEANKYEITVGAGVPFKDVQAYLEKRGYICRCDPNTPRAATGGIAATGSNGGRKAFEVILHGRAVVQSGIAVCFEPTPYENEKIKTEPFLLCEKFFGVEHVSEIETALNISLKNKTVACIEPAPIHIPLQGIKASANKHLQTYEKTTENSALDEMQNNPKIPISSLVGIEGCSGFIYEVTLEIEKPKQYIISGRIHFSNTDNAVAITKEIKKKSWVENVSFLEILTGPSIRKFLKQDFPNVFFDHDEAVIIFGIESQTTLENNFHASEISALANANSAHYFECTPPETLQSGTPLFHLMKKPREELPKKLRTKCKTDMEIKTEYLGEVLKLIEHSSTKDFIKHNIDKTDVLFGHLTPHHSAIMHWNIGGFDLYREEEASLAWGYLKTIITGARLLGENSSPSASFTGEHGVAGKAPLLWLGFLSAKEFEKMCAIKDALDPKNLFNPETLFLKTQHSRSLRARLLEFGNDLILAQRQQNPVLNFIAEQALKCTRCNSCKICPVIDAEHEIRKETKSKNLKSSVLPNKRNILMFLERFAVTEATLQSSSSQNSPSKKIVLWNKFKELAFQESADILKKCFYCRKCDKACPVDIQIHPLVRAYHEFGGSKQHQKKLETGSFPWNFLYDRLMGEDFFKSITYKFMALGIAFGKPFFWALLKIKFIPTWLKTYFSPPTLSFSHYEPLKEGVKILNEHNYTLVSGNKNHQIFSELFPNTVFIRFRGCMDTFGNPNATKQVDKFFKEILNLPMLDLEKKMCCGFPFEADGLHTRAQQSQLNLATEIATAIASVPKTQKTTKFVLFSNCPTCVEALKETNVLLQEKFSVIQNKLKNLQGYNAQNFLFESLDTTEIALQAVEKLGLMQAFKKIPKTVGLKVPCHNTSTATSSQIKLLGLFYEKVAAYDNCCGLSGTGRLKFPKIGTKIAEKLFEQIAETPPDAVVSGCPSCRDGVKMQKDAVSAITPLNFEISGIFEQIYKDSKSLSI